MNRKGMSLMEIIVSVVLMGLILVGMTNVFVAGRRNVVHNRSRMASGELGNFFLEPLKMQVSQEERNPGAQDGWDEANNLLRILAGQNERTWSEPAQTLNYINYTPEYTVSRVMVGATDLGMRRVRLRVTWPRIATP